MTIARNSALAPSEDMISSEVDGEVMLISISSGRYFALDGIGSEIWRRLQKPISFETLSAELQDHFGGDPVTIDAEALEFVSKLVDRGLVSAT